MLARLLATGGMVLLVLLPLPGRAATPPGPEASKQKEMGDAWARLGNWKRAVDCYRRVLAKHPGDFETKLKLASGLHRLGQNQQALQLLQRLARQHPQSVPLALARASLLMELKRPRQACRLYQTVLDRHPRDERAGFGKATCLEILSRGSADAAARKQAEQAYRDYLQAHPQGLYALQARRALERLQLGATHELLERARQTMAAGEMQRAVGLLQKFLRAHPRYEQAHYLLGLALASPQVDDTERALAAWAKAPHVKEAVLQRALLAFEDDDLEQAEKLLRRALQLDDKYAEAYYHLGMVLAAQPEQQRQAIEPLTRVLRLAPKTALAERAASKLQLLTGKLVMLREGEVIDRATEVELGQKLSKLIEAKYKLLDNPRLNQRLSAILGKLSRNADLPPGTMPLRVKLLDMPAINAIAFTGGNIYLCRGLLDFIDKEFAGSDDAYAVVLSHELVHLVLRHGLRMLDLVSGSRALTAGSSFDARGLSKLMVGLSRQHEFQADQIGALVAYRAGYNPGLAYRFHRRLVARGMEVPEGADHPTHRERAARVKEYLLSLRTKTRYFDSGLRALDQHDYTGAASHFEVFLGAFPRNFAARNNLGVARLRQAQQIAISDRPWWLSSDIDPRSGLRRIRVRGGKEAKDREKDRRLQLLQEATTLFDRLVHEDPEYLPAQINLSTSLLESGQFQRAERLLANLLRQQPESAAVANNLAVLRAQNGHLEQAEQLLQAALQKNPKMPELRYNLALVLTRRGEREQARRAWLAFLEVDSSSGWAQRARQQLAGLN